MRIAASICSRVDIVPFVQFQVNYSSDRDSPFKTQVIQPYKVMLGQVYLIVRK